MQERPRSVVWGDLQLLPADASEREARERERLMASALRIPVPSGSGERLFALPNLNTQAHKAARKVLASIGCKASLKHDSVVVVGALVESFCEDLLDKATDAAAERLRVSGRHGMTNELVVMQDDVQAALETMGLDAWFGRLQNSQIDVSRSPTDYAAEAFHPSLLSENAVATTAIDGFPPIHIHPQGLDDDADDAG